LELGEEESWSRNNRSLVERVLERERAPVLVPDLERERERLEQGGSTFAQMCDRMIRSNICVRHRLDQLLECWMLDSLTTSMIVWQFAS